MALPYKTITKISNNEPDAVPSLWNKTYEEIDANFADHEKRVGDNEAELKTARGSKPSIADRLKEIDDKYDAAGVEMQGHIVAALKFALDQAAQANYGIKALRQQAQQEGVFTIKNRGVVSGCNVTKSDTATRNLSIDGGVCFAGGRSWSVAAGNNAASVPSNTGSGSVTVYAYLFNDSSGLWRMAVTTIGASVPDGAITIYSLTIPSGNSDATDPYLAKVTLTSVRRFEASFPKLLDSPASASPMLNTLSANDYNLSFDVVSATGAPCDSRQIIVSSRATNGFTVLLASSADNVAIRWRASKLNN